ncbi:MAG: patatin-like phospholipase family protein, partial [Pirellulaceae bacterium]|nr:patatin-like phospholipase family protein [Pirellulaceae bacterium]
MASSAKSIDDVLADELEEIRKRRDVCGLLPSAEAEGPSGESEPEPVDSTDPRSRIRHSLVGVALSGGGVRAAAFSLGFLQALYKAGRMRFVDYLSTVSGGGYAGALFSSEAARFNGDIDWSREGNQNRLPIDVDSTGRQADRIRGLALHGRMMGNFVRLFSRHLWGFILINTFIISGIFAVASLMAFVMRLPWSGFALPVLAELKFSTDITVPFFWTFIALLVWLLCQGIAVAAKVLRKPIPPLTQYSYLLLIATIGLGVVTMLAIGDFGLSSWITNFGLSPVVEQRANQVLAWVTTIAGGLFATTLLPYVMPRTLLRSGGSRRGTPKSFIFHASGYALVFGAPLFVFYFLAHENLSGHNETRDNVDTLTSSHLRLPERFVRHLESQSLSEEKTDRDVSRQLLAAMNNNFTADQLQQQAATPRIPERQAAIKDLIDSIEEKKRNDKNISFFPRLLQAVAYPMGLDSEFAGRVQANKDRLAYVAQMADRINVNCLSDPRFLTKQLTEPPVPAPPPNDAEAQTERAVEPPSRASEEGPDHKELLTSLGLVDEQTEPLDSGRLIDALGELRSAHHHVRTITGKKDGTITIGAYAVALRNVGGVELAPEAEMSSKNIAAVMRAHDYRLGQLLCEIDDVLSRAQVDSALRERIQREHVRLTVLPHVQESQFNVVDIVQQVKHRIAGTKVKSKRELLLDRLVEEHYPAGVSTEDQLKDIQVAHDRLRDLLREIRENNWIVLAALYPNNIASQQ